MPTRKLNYDDVFAMGLKLPGVVKNTNMLGTSLKVNGKLFVCPALNKSAEPNSLMVRVSLDKREELLFTQPDIYYIKPHYLGHPCVLVRLDKISRKDLQYLLETSLPAMTANKKK